MQDSTKQSYLVGNDEASLGLCFTQFRSMKFFKVSGNIEEEKFCMVCDDLCGGGVGLQDYRCSWLVTPTIVPIHTFRCVQVVHSRCKRQIGDDCDFGQLKRFVIPPYCVTTRKSVNRSQRYVRISANFKSIQNFQPVVDTMKAPVESDQWQPIIAVVNPKSGSGAGKGVLRKLRSHLHPVQVIILGNTFNKKHFQVIDITKSHLRSSLAWLDEHKEVLVLDCV